ncbi:MAG: ABC transporter permease [Ardenticatenaceae bacterium]|nr:ABC transporter permease [Anaerolineales bacterium]MCB8938591.1 ABC transporter permease [Ardenticatenaceae bacterium]MCB8973724.1 ABC transporter permease [Ardenticatenaceae bacterium]
MTPTDAVAGLDVNYNLREQNRLEKLVGPEWYRLLKGVVTNPLSVTGLIIVAIFLLIGAFAPTLAPAPNENWDPYTIPRDGFKPEPLPPGTEWKQNVPATVPGWYRVITGNETWVHILGTTSGQYDIWYGIIWGTRTALLAGTAVVAISALFGILVGSIAGFYGGWVDEIMMRIVEVFIVFPALVAVLVLSSILVPIFGQSLWPAMIALVVFGWMGYARLLRGDILSNKERDYVLAARASGAKDTHIILKHVLPNAIFPTLVFLSLDMGAIVLSFAALSFLGVGVEPGYADWGQIVSFARDWILTLDKHWYIVLFPGMALLLYGLGWNLLGDALRDILDPKLRKG